MMVISGNATTAEGLPVDLIRVFRWPDDSLAGIAQPDSNGDWSFTVLGTGEYGITYIAAGCQPVTHGPYFFDGAWTPANIDTALWLDASVQDSVEADTLNRVSNWLDLSGNNRAATQPSTSRQPLYASPISVDANGSSAMNLPTMLPEKAAIFAVFSATNSGRGTLIRQGFVTWNWIVRTENSGTLSSYFSANGTTSLISLNKPAGSFVFSQTFDGAHHVASVNGNSQSVSLSGNLTSPDADNVLFASPNMSEFLAGSLKELIIIDRGITETDRQRLEGYLAWKWGLQSDLPESHPYKESAPAQ